LRWFSKSVVISETKVKERAEKLQISSTKLQTKHNNQGTKFLDNFRTDELFQVLSRENFKLLGKITERANNAKKVVISLY